MTGFDVWKLKLRRDCELQGKLFAFEAMGDPILRILWERGLNPSVEAIVGSPPEHAKPN